MTYKTGVFEVAKHYEGITKWSAVINQIDRIPEFLRRAFYQLRTGRGGPVLLEVPREIWGQEYPGELEYSPVGGNLYAPDPADVRGGCVCAARGGEPDHPRGARAVSTPTLGMSFRRPPSCCRRR